jgi:FixJ family two-component response regulator
MTDLSATIAVVDDDASVRQAFVRLLRAAGHRAESFACAGDLLAHPSLGDFGCVLLDVDLPDLNGLELQATLERLDAAPPIVFITGHGDIPMTVRAMQAGAIDFLTKPCEADTILRAVARALQTGSERRRRQQLRASERARLATLTPREHEVLAGIVAGLRNKQIGARLDICEKTVKVHRAHVMEKMAVRSVADLVRMAEHLGVGTENSPGD